MRSIFRLRHDTRHPIFLYEDDRTATLERVALGDRDLSDENCAFVIAGEFLGCEHGSFRLVSISSQKEDGVRREMIGDRFEYIAMMTEYDHLIARFECVLDMFD